MNSGSASTTVAPRSCTQRASSSTVSLGPSGASGRPDPVAPIARAKAGAVDVTSAAAGAPSGVPSSSSRSAAPAAAEELDTRPHVATCDHRRLVVALPLCSDQRRPRSTTAGHGSLRLRESWSRRDRAYMREVARRTAWCIRLRDRSPSPRPSFGRSVTLTGIYSIGRLSAALLIACALRLRSLPLQVLESFAVRRHDLRDVLEPGRTVEHRVGDHA